MYETFELRVLAMGTMTGVSESLLLLLLLLMADGGCLASSGAVLLPLPAVLELAMGRIFKSKIPPPPAAACVPAAFKFFDNSPQRPAREEVFLAVFGVEESATEVRVGVVVLLALLLVEFARSTGGAGLALVLVLFFQKLPI